MKKNIMLIILTISLLTLVSCKKKMITDITLSETQIVLGIGETKKITATFTPEKAINNVLTWTTENMLVAKVTEGNITGVSTGITNIKVSDSTGTIVKNCTVEVIDKEFTWDGVIPSKPTTLKVKEGKETITLLNNSTLEVDVIELNTLNEFIYFFQSSKLEDITSSKQVLIRLNHDIYLNDKNWTPSSFLTNITSSEYKIFIDGNNKNIYNLSVNNDRSAMFDITTSGYLEIRNLNIINSNIISTGYHCAVLNCNTVGDVTYNNCYIKNATLKGTKYIGTIASYSRISNFINCKVEDSQIEITPTDDSFNVGGLTGLINAGQISNVTLKNINITVKNAENVETTKQRIGILTAVMQDETTIKSKIEISNCQINNEKVTTNNQVIFLDNRTNKDNSKITIE